PQPESLYNYSDRTIARQFQKPFAWPDLHQRVLLTALDPRSELISAPDASFLPKSGVTVQVLQIMQRQDGSPLVPGRRTASAGNLSGRRTAARWRGGGVAPGGAGSRGPPASAPAGRGALGMRADPSSSGRVAREHGTAWVHAAGGKSCLKFLY